MAECDQYEFLRRRAFAVRRGGNDLLTHREPAGSARWSLPATLAGSIWLVALATFADEPVASAPSFVDVTASSGIDFEHHNGASGRHLLPEITGGGVALFDFEQDGDLDVFFVDSGALEPGHGSKHSRLFGNQLAAEGPVSSREMHFREIELGQAATTEGYGMGVASGDFDNDGFTDLYVVELGANRLLRNDGGRGLIDVTEVAGAAVPGWSTSATFFDFDRDGWLDLYVVNYLAWSLEDVVACFAPSSRRDYCGPDAYPPAADRLLRNRGDGTFEPIASATLARAPAPGLGVVAFDANRDGWLDLFVANDGQANQLWINQAGESLDDQALLTGVAVNRLGLPEASMGVAAGDMDRDGREDLVLSHLSGETNTLYTAQGAGLFAETTLLSGLGPPSLKWTGFGIAWLDVQNDGWLDLVVANGAVRLQDGADDSLGQPNQLFLADGAGRFRDASIHMPPSFRQASTSRGLAIGDLDNDGDSDLVVVDNAGPAHVYRNDNQAAGSSVGVRVLDEHGRDALGVRTELSCDSELRASAVVRTDGSYASASDARLLFGIGDLECDWNLTLFRLDGRIEHVALQGRGRAAQRSRFAYRVLRPADHADDASEH